MTLNLTTPWMTLSLTTPWMTLSLTNFYPYCWSVKQMLNLHFSLKNALILYYLQFYPNRPYRYFILHSSRCTKWKNISSFNTGEKKLKRKNSYSLHDSEYVLLLPVLLRVIIIVIVDFYYRYRSIKMDFKWKVKSFYSLWALFIENIDNIVKQFN